MEKVIINVNNMTEYNKLKAQVLWVGEGRGKNAESRCGSGFGRCIKSPFHVFCTQKTTFYHFLPQTALRMIRSICEQLLMTRKQSDDDYYV